MMVPMEIAIPVGSGLCTFILGTVYKKTKNEKMDRSELIKYAFIVALIAFIVVILQNNNGKEPILSEPFISTS